MTAKEYLEEVQRFQIIVEQLKSEKAFLEKVQTLRVANRSTKNHCQSLINEINSEIHCKIQEITIRIDRIYSLNNSLYSEILYQRYVFQKSMTEIARKLNYSPRYIFNLCSKALKKFELEHSTVLQKDCESNEPL